MNRVIEQINQEPVNHPLYKVVVDMALHRVSVHEVLQEKIFNLRTKKEESEQNITFRTSVRVI